MIEGTDIADFIQEHLNEGNKYDFMLRTKVDRSSRLVLVVDNEDIDQQRICRYYPSKNGGKLVKIMKPLPISETGEDRRLSIDSQWNVKTCNNINTYDGDVDIDYYIAEANKLVIQ